MTAGPGQLPRAEVTVVVAGVVAADALGVITDPMLGVLAHAALAVGLLLASACRRPDGGTTSAWLAAAALVPLSRVTTWGLPFGEGSMAARTIVAGAAITGAVVLLARSGGDGWTGAVGIRAGPVRPALVAVAAAVPLGILAAAVGGAATLGGSGALSLIALSVVGPVADELLFRGLLLARATAVYDRAGPAVVVALWSSSFLRSSPAFVVLAVTTGLLLGWARQRSGSLAGPVVAHAVVNVLAHLA